MRLGADEAGKGPVLGSMFAAAVRGPADAIPDDVADSKRLTPDQRTDLATELGEHPEVSVGVAEVPVDRIDDPATDMNTLTVEAQAEALEQVGRSGDVAVVDAGDTVADRFGRRVSDRVDGIEIDAEHRADERHSIVAAASVVAKVTRDSHVGELAVEYGDVGSGYPHDQTTRAFLSGYVEDHGQLPACARRSWGTAKEILAAAEQADLEEFA